MSISYSFNRPTCKRPRKYRPGPVLTTIEQLLDCAERGVWIFDGDRVYHPHWVINGPVVRVASKLNAGKYRIAFRSQTVPLFFEAFWCEAPTNPCWFVVCREGRWSAEYTLPMTAEAVIRNCTVIARSRGHWGPVHVTFIKEFPKPGSSLTNHEFKSFTPSDLEALANHKPTTDYSRLDALYHWRGRGGKTIEVSEDQVFVPQPKSPPIAVRPQQPAA